MIARENRRPGHRSVWMVMLSGLALSAGVLCGGKAAAGDVEILAATARQSGGAWTVSVTLKHADGGWDHYADLWRVLSPDGKVLGERVLLHPHVDEQPFTRSQSGIVIPEDLDEVVIQARDTLHGVSPQTYRLTLER